MDTLLYAVSSFGLLSLSRLFRVRKRIAFDLHNGQVRQKQERDDPHFLLLPEDCSLPVPLLICRGTTSGQRRERVFSLDCWPLTILTLRVFSSPSPFAFFLCPPLCP